MKKLAVITNELFKDYLKIVSTEDLEKTLDNPDVPVPYECLNSVENTNSDALAEQLSTFFIQSKIPNKDFYKLNADNVVQLEFMMNLIKLSSNGSAPKHPLVNRRPLPTTEPISIEETNPKLEVIQSVEEIKPVITNLVEDSVLPFEAPIITYENNIEFVYDNIESEQLIESTKEVVSEPLIVNNIEEENPFFPKEEVKLTENTQDPVIEESKVENVELIAGLNIPKNSTIHLAKKDSVTATLIDENNAIFEGVTMSLTDAAKAALKKAGMFGVSTGNIAWLYNGTALKDLV